MDGILQTQYRQHLPAFGQMGSRTSANHPTQKAQRKGTCPRTGPSTLAQRLLRRTRFNLHGLNPSQSGRPSSMKPLTGEPYARKSPVRFGGRGGGHPPVPTPIGRSAGGPRPQRVTRSDSVKHSEFSAVSEALRPGTGRAPGEEPTNQKSLPN